MIFYLNFNYLPVGKEPLQPLLCNFLCARKFQLKRNIEPRLLYVKLH